MGPNKQKTNGKKVIYHWDVEQGSPEWIKLHLGIPSAGSFWRIMKPRLRERSTQWEKYLAEKMTEWLLGAPHDSSASDWMTRGKELEESARLWYELDTGLTARKIGFVTTDDGLVGVSPDFLVEPHGNSIGGEIKIFAAANHMKMAMGAMKPGKEVLQAQGGMWICDCRWWDLVYWNPVLPSRIIRLERDESYIADIAKYVGEFVTEMLAQREKLKAMGHAPAEKKESDVN